MSYPIKAPVREDSLRYGARTVLATLTDELAASRSITKAADKVLKATKIRLFLKALDYKEFLTREQREKIWYALIQISGVYQYPTAPVLGERERPSILNGAGGDLTVNQYYDNGVAFANTANVAPGTETIDSFAMSLGKGVRWDYVITDGTNQRAGSVVGTWLADGSDYDSTEISTGVEIGATEDVTLDITISAGNVILQATEASTGWLVSGKRYIIP